MQLGIFANGLKLLESMLLSSLQVLLSFDVRYDGLSCHSAIRPYNFHVRFQQKEACIHLLLCDWMMLDMLSYQSSRT